MLPLERTRQGGAAVVTAEEWLSNFNATIADVKAKTAEFQRNLEASGVTETSPDGSISVSVAPNGSLTDLRIAESAWRGSGGDLAAKIMHLARRAQRAAAVNVAEAFEPLGADSQAMHMITGYLPEPESDDEPDAGAGYAFAEEPEQPPTPPQPPHPPRLEPPPRPARPSRRRADLDDEDFGDEGIFGSDDR
jgi:hypothetical protein